MAERVCGSHTISRASTRATSSCLSDFSNRALSAQPYRGPFPILNGALNLGGSSDLGPPHTPQRVVHVHAASCRSRSQGRRLFSRRRHPGLPADSISGRWSRCPAPRQARTWATARLPLVAFLLTMFNVRLAWWFPNPGRRWWSRPKLPLSTWYLVKEMFGLADETNRFVNVSDGGHFENLGIYELVRRRCRVIIACDAECDSKLTFGSLGNVIRLCETDFRARIDIDVESIRRGGDSGSERSALRRRPHHVFQRQPRVSDLPEVVLDRRRRGQRRAVPGLARRVSARDDRRPVLRRGSIRELPAPGLSHRQDDIPRCRAGREPGRNGEASWPTSGRRQPSATVRSRPDASPRRDLGAIPESTATLHPLLVELMANRPSPPPAVPTEEQLVMCMELFQLMENVFVALRLADFWEHPDNRGWVVLFTMWAKSGTFRMAWTQHARHLQHRFRVLLRAATRDVEALGARYRRPEAALRQVMLGRRPVRSGPADVRGGRRGRSSCAFGSRRDRRSLTNRKMAATTPTIATNSGKNSNSSTDPLYDRALHTIPVFRQAAIVSRSIPSSVRMRSVCSPRPGIFPILGSTSSKPNGGRSARSGPAGESTSRHFPRAASWGWSRNSSHGVHPRVGDLRAHPGDRRPAGRSFPRRRCTMIVSSSSWCSTRSAFELKRGSLANAG